MARRRLAPILAALLIVMVVLGVLDQSRWQPWFYQEIFMLGALTLQPRRVIRAEPPSVALNTCRLIVASVYLWSGLHKVNRSFVTETFLWFLQGFSFMPTAALPYLAWLGLVVPILEAGTGIALVTRRWRPIAIVIAIFTHAFILAALGPLGRNVNQVVWVWNLAMIAFVVLLFRGTAHLSARDILSPRNGWYHALVLVLFGVMPALSFVYLWDSYLSFAVYSANVKTARIHVSDRLSSELPADVRRWVRRDEHGRNILDHVGWSSQELRVPVYPQSRIYRGLARHACRYATATGDVELLIEERSLPALVRTLTHARLDPQLRVTRREDCGSLGG